MTVCTYVLTNMKIILVLTFCSLRELGGETPKDPWKGELNATYRIGPGFDSGSQFEGKYVLTLPILLL